LREHRISELLEVVKSRRLGSRMRGKRESEEIATAWWKMRGAEEK
jgi:hypothetical protein